MSTKIKYIHQNLLHSKTYPKKIHQYHYPNASEVELKRLPSTWSKGGSDVHSLTLVIRSPRGYFL